MPFDSLAHRVRIELADLPFRWLPLIQLYDADLPLFPICYFHTHVDPGTRPTQEERAFGYLERLDIADDNTASAVVVANKNLGGGDAAYRTPVVGAIRDRLGLNDAVVRNDVITCFQPPYGAANAVLTEIWERVIPSYGGRLPFGKIWDEVLGLSRFVASFYSQSGRKGELIQTHYFASQFGERIQSAGGLANVDFFLLPSFTELSDAGNPLTHFPRFARLVELAAEFVNRYCSQITVEGITLSRFHNTAGGRFDTPKLLALISGLPPALQPSAFECFNAFNKGPQRTVLFLMMLADLRASRLRPRDISAVQFAALQDGLGNTYQSPKVLQIFAQQAFGNPAAIPLDTWVKTFLSYPLQVARIDAASYTGLFQNATNLGKVERLIWVTAQARKVHSSACNDALWCLKKSTETTARGANPLTCTVCLPAIRNQCPAFAHIRDSVVCFNRPVATGETFSVQTSGGNITTPNQRFVRCQGSTAFGSVVDDYTPQDKPDGFAPFPNHPTTQDTMTVGDFVARYRR